MNRKLKKAIKSQNPEAVRAALANGADVNHRTNGLMRDTYSPVIYCIDHGTPEILQILLDAGADPNVRQKSSFPKFLASGMLHLKYTSPLMKAVQAEKAEFVKVLLGAPKIFTKLGTNQDGLLRSSNPQTPLEYARQHGLDDIVALFEEYIAQRPAKKVQEYTAKAEEFRRAAAEMERLAQQQGGGNAPVPQKVRKFGL